MKILISRVLGTMAVKSDRAFFYLQERTHLTEQLEATTTTNKNLAVTS